jgi:hypothetical protein
MRDVGDRTMSSVFFVDVQQIVTRVRPKDATETQNALLRCVEIEAQFVDEELPDILTTTGCDHHRAVHEVFASSRKLKDDGG